MVAALVLLYVSWGSTYVAFKVSFEGLPPLLSTGVRFTVAGCIVLAIARGRGSRPSERRTVVRPSHLLSALLLGFLMVGLGTGAVVVAVKHLPTGTTALAQASVPMWVALGDRVAFRTRLARRALAGLILGFMGILALAGPVRGGRGESGGLVWVGLVVVGSAGWAAGALASRVLPVVDDRMTATGMLMVIGGAMVAATGLITGDLGRLHVQTLRYTSVLAFLYLLIVSALIGFNLYMWLLRTASPTLVATSSYVDPALALFFGWAVLGEGLSVRSLLAAIVIVAGAALIVTSNDAAGGRQRPAAPVPPA